MNKDSHRNNTQEYFGQRSEIQTNVLQTIQSNTMDQRVKLASDYDAVDQATNQLGDDQPPRDKSMANTRLINQLNSETIEKGEQRIYLMSDSNQNDKDLLSSENLMKATPQTANAVSMFV